jgi:hypothetical protein
VLCKLFDADYYRMHCPGSRAPLLHFIAVGAYQGRKPHPLFDPAFYLRKYPDVAAAGVNPLLHYLLRGTLERRKPHPLFEPDYYLLRCPQAKASGVDPLIYFLKCRGLECCSPHPLFDCESYVGENPGAGEVNPLVHYLMSGGEETVEGSQMEVLDVKVALVFPGAERTPARKNCVTVWQDGHGRTQFIAPPQQRPFFQSLSFEQLRAQA